MTTVPLIPELGPSDLLLRRDFAADPDRVWQLLVDPDQLALWFGPSDVHVDRDSVRIDPRPGGHWDLDMVDNQTGAHLPLHSTLLAVAPPRYLAGIADAETGTGVDLEDVSLRIWLDPVELGTRMTIVEGPFEPGMRDATADGWRSSFSKADAVLSLP